MEGTIFYSWQSDSSNNTNRGFILDALERAVKEIRADGSIQIEPRVDRDTSGISGSPNIPETILAKIDGCLVFVADVSIINSGSKFRSTPNPNVLFELGYALKVLGGWGRIIMVCNESLGKIEKLPFDLPTRRVIPYSVATNNPDKSAERRLLTLKLQAQIRLIVDQIPNSSESIRTADQVADEVLQNAARIAAGKRHESRRQQWMRSIDSIKDVLDSVHEIFDLVERKLLGNTETFDALGIVFMKERLLLVLSTPKYGSQILVEGLNESEPARTNFSEIYLQQILFTKDIRWHTTEAVKKARLSPDLGKDGSVVWKEQEGKPFTASEIADRSFRWLLNQIENPETSIDEQARVLGAAFGSGSRRRT